MLLLRRPLESTVYTVVAYSVSLKRQVRVVAVVWPGSRSSRMEVLNSTSITMTAATIIVLYRTRFSMEFPFRDSKRPSVLMRSSVVNRAALTKTGAWPLAVPDREFHREPCTVERDDGRGRHGDGGAVQHLRPA